MVHWGLKGRVGYEIAGYWVGLMVFRILIPEAAS